MPFVLGGDVVVLFYPFLLHVFEFGVYANYLILTVASGLVTRVLPWVILMPAFGRGFWESKSPDRAGPVIFHIAYGLDIGLTLIAYYAVVG